jgi:hypothetical protein
LSPERLEDRVVPTLLGQQLFPADNPWNQNISNAPVAANSAAIIAHIGASTRLTPDWYADNPANGSSPLYGIPFSVVHGNSAAKISVTIDNYPGESDVVPVPIPANAVIEGDFQNGPNPNGGGYNPNQRGDSHLIVWDEDNNIAYELFGVTRPADPTLFPNTSNVELAHTDGLWHAAQETVWDMKADAFRTLGETSADAAGLSILAGLARPDEGLTVAQGGQGVINHALRVTLPSGDINPQYIYPAAHMVGTSQGPNNLPMGGRLRLANTPAINTLINNMPPESQILARAMQQYGLIVADIGSSMFVSGASASMDANNSINLTWDLNDIFASNGLEALNAGDFEVVNLTPVVTSLSASGGVAGSTITISGQNFSGAAGHLEVFFGTTASPFVTVMSDTLLSVVVPNGSGTVAVTVQSGVNETDIISSNPNANINAPIFGYGTSAVTPADMFTTVTSFVVSGYPSTVTAGSANNFTVTAEDAFGHTVTAFTGTVHFTSSALKSVLPSNYTFTAADAGIHSFSATLRSSGIQSITATDTATSSITGTQSGITVNPAATHHLILSRFPIKTTAGVAQSFRVTAQDFFGNTTPGYTGTVKFSSTDPNAILPANYTFGAADAGVHNFSGTLKTAGTQSLTVTDTGNASVAATMSGISVVPAATSVLLVNGFPTSVLLGATYNFTVIGRDAYGNTTPAYTGTVKFTSTDSAAALPANYTFVSGDAGVHTFSATLNTPGTQLITATDTVTASITGSESGISVVAVQPTAGVSGPSTGVPGQPLTYTLTASESGLVAGTVYSYSINWGDGSPVQTVSGPTGTLVTHAFPATGPSTVSVTATDPSNHASVLATMSVTLSTTLMETDPYDASLTALYVGGTLGNDTIAITPVAGDGVMVGMNFVNYGSFFPTGHVIVYSQSGNDIIKTAPQTINGVLTYVNVPVLFFGGGGNDILNVTGSIANNVLVGVGSTDRLLGGHGRDILIGGAGKATIQAGAGDDILIGGATDYDNNAAALAALLAEWGRTDIDYSTRIAHLTGSLSGGLNGSYFLNSSTVHDNGQADNLYGGPGADWFLTGTLDAIFNKTTGEVVTQI